MTSPAAVAPAKTAARPLHLYEVDILRILTFLCVIAVHTTSATAASTELGLYALLGLVHFTRDVFFALSGFVLIYSYLSKPVPMRKFLPRRFLLVGVPYVVWSAIYFFSSNLRSPSGTLGDTFGRFVVDLLEGTAWYHLYFLLVTMQVYLLVPVIAWVVRKTRGQHVMFLVVFFVLQVAMFAYYAYAPEQPAWLASNSKSFFFSYLFFILLGAVLADHALEFMAWVRNHRRPIGFVTLGTGILTLAVFAFQYWVLGFSVSRAGTPVQPIIVVWSVGIGLGFLALGSLWAERRVAGSRFSRAVDVASDRSFGIFLSHPLVLWILLTTSGTWLVDGVAKPWLTLVAYITVVLGAVLITEVARRTPASLILTGRPFMHKRKPVEPAGRPDPRARVGPVGTSPTP